MRSSAAGQCRNDSGVGEVAGAEHAGVLRTLEACEPRFELAEQGMVAGDEPRRAGARAVALDRCHGGLFHARVLRQVEVVVAGKRDEPAAATLQADAVARRVDQRAPQVPAIEVGKLSKRERIERFHVIPSGPIAPPHSVPPRGGGQGGGRSRGKQLHAGRSGATGLVRGPCPRLAALRADEDSRSAAAGGAHERQPDRARGRARTDRRHRILVDRLPRL